MLDDQGADEGRPLVSNRTVEILVALLLLAASATRRSWISPILWRDNPKERPFN